MIIAIDCDDTICELQQQVIEIFNQKYCKSYELNDFKDYDIENDLPLQDAVNFKTIYGEVGLYQNIMPTNGAQSGLRKLINRGHEIFIVTNAIPDTFSEKVKFIKHYFPFIDNAHIVSMKHKEYFRCDIMVEDNVRNLLASPYYYRILLDRPWNQNVYDEVYGIHRCKTWDEIIDTIEKIYKEDQELMKE